MPVIPPSLFMVMKRFPDRKEAIKRLFKESEDFRNVCEDHRACREALGHWNQSVSEEAAARCEEYATLLRDLEKEILENYLDCE